MAWNDNGDEDRGGDDLSGFSGGDIDALESGMDIDYGGGSGGASGSTLSGVWDKVKTALSVLSVTQGNLWGASAALGLVNDLANKYGEEWSEQDRAEITAAIGGEYGMEATEVDAMMSEALGSDWTSSATADDSGSFGDSGDAISSQIDELAGSYNMTDLLGGYQSDVSSAVSAFTDATATLADQWNAFMSMSNGMNLSLWDKAADYEKAADAAYSAAYDEYDANIGSLPSLAMKVPETMGGATIDLAPGAWEDMYSDILGSKTGALDSQYSTLNDLLGTQQGTIKSMGENTSTSLANLLSLAQGNLGAKMGEAEANLKPYDDLLDLFKMNEQIEGNINVAEAGKDDESWWEPLVSAGSYVLGNNENILDDIADLFN